MLNDTENVNPDAAPADQELILNLNFVPQWARRPPDVRRFAAPGSRETAGPERARGRRTRERRERPAPRSRRSARADAQRPLPAAGAAAERRSAPPAAVHSPTPLHVVFLPEHRHLSAIVRQIKATRRAYPLMELAHLVLEKTGAHRVKIESPADRAGCRLLQCRRCKFVATQPERLMAHLVAEHLEEHYTREETSVAPPSGTFTCIARCRLTGRLLGPPNHHRYVEEVNALHRSRFAHMSLQAYSAQIEVLHDEALIEQWKADNTRQTVYRAIRGTDSGDAPPLSEAEAAAVFARDIAPGLISETRRAVVSGDVARRLDDPRLREPLREAWERESRFPLELSLALRAALHHKQLHIFKAGRRQTFATCIRPRVLDPEHTVPEIREVLEHLRKHPGCSRKDLLKALRPELDPDARDADSAFSSLRWLIDKGHIIEFFNGALSVPLRNGEYGSPHQPASSPKRKNAAGKSD